MSKITYDEIIMLDNCRSDLDWARACDKIKKNHDGCYPEDWWPVVKLSGLMDSVLSRWGETSELKVTRL